MDINIICFIAVTIIAIVCGSVEIKMKPPHWKLQVIWIALMEVLAVLLLINRLMI